MNTTSKSFFSKTSSIYLVVAAIFVVGFVIAAVAVTRSSSSLSTGKLKVVAAENFWGNIAAQIGGDQVRVTSIITDPEVDPHLYESNARNAAAVSTADIVIVNGLGYDEFMDKLLDASKNDRRGVVNVASLTGAAKGSNPHLWYDLTRVQRVATEIKNALVSKDPAHKSVYEENLATFNTQTRQVLDELALIKTKFGGSPVAYTEPVPMYLLENAGLTAKTPEGFAEAIEEAGDPSPADTATMEALMTGKGVKALLYNSQATSPVTERIKSLAIKAGVPVVAVTETMPTNEENYQSWMLRQAKDLYNALNGR